MFLLFTAIAVDLLACKEGSWDSEMFGNFLVMNDVLENLSRSSLKIFLVFSYFLQHFVSFCSLCGRYKLYSCADCYIATEYTPQETYENTGFPSSCRIRIEELLLYPGTLGAGL
jgi:hypothetical protein